MAMMCPSRPGESLRRKSLRPLAYTPPDDTPSIRVGVDDLRRLHRITTSPQTTDADGNRHSCERVQRRPQLHQRHRQHLPSRGIPRHARRGARDQRGQRAERQPRVPHQVRVRCSSTSTTGCRGLVRAVRHPADAVARLRRGHLPLSVPGDDVRRARRATSRRRTPAPRSTTTCRRTTATSTSASTTARTTTGPKSNDQKALHVRGTVRPFAAAARWCCAACGHRSSTTATTT